MTLTKQDLVNRLYDKGLFLQNESKEFLELVLEMMKKTLENGEKIKISGFGNFQLINKKERTGRNPKSGVEHKVSARRIVGWKPSDKLRNKF